MNPPHGAQDPVAIIAMVCRLVGEVGLIARYPLIGVVLAEMPVYLRQFADEVGCA
ncbi:hypothetical protein [Escherichia coli]|uniref:hypothetical protein n=1 Tax=Escherichia coli TaxID=562 RepID=UPI001C57A687|nr:hypothetical protein [Escherichia coli]